MNYTEQALVELNNNLARLAVIQSAMLDELHMIRRAIEGEPGEFNDPLANAYEFFEIEEDSTPRFM